MLRMLASRIRALRSIIRRARCKNKKYQIAKKNRLGSPKRVAQSAFLR